MSPRVVTVDSRDIAHPTWTGDGLRRFDAGLMSEIALLVNLWSRAEVGLVELAAGCLRADHEPVAVMLGQVQNSRTLVDWVKTLVKWTVAASEADTIISFLQTRLEPIRQIRNDFAHSLWCRYRPDPASVVIVHPSQVTYSAAHAHLRSLAWDAKQEPDEQLYKEALERLAALRNPNPGPPQGLLYSKWDVMRATIKAMREVKNLSWIALLAQPERVPVWLVRSLLSKEMRGRPYARTPTIRRPPEPPPQSP